MTGASALTKQCLCKQFARFLGHDELNARRTSLVSPEQPVLCIPVQPTHATVFWA